MNIRARVNKAREAKGVTCPATEAQTTRGYLRGLDDPVVQGPNLKGVK